MTKLAAIEREFERLAKEAGMTKLQLLQKLNKDEYIEDNLAMKLHTLKKEYQAALKEIN